MSKKVLFVLGGGYSSEKEISAKSARFVYSKLSKEMYDVHFIMITAQRWYAVTDSAEEIDIDKNRFTFTLCGKTIKCDYVINVIHGTPGENGLLQGYFDILGIKYIGCSALCSTITFDKVWTKRILAEYGIPMAKDYVITKGDDICEEEIVEKLALPLFVKPSNSGSSFGVTKVKNRSEIRAALESAYSESSVAILEEAISGHELACGLYVTARGETVLPITEIISQNEFFDYEAKYQGRSAEITPAQIDENVAKRVREYSLTAYKALRCSGIVRVDFILNGETPYFIEVNSIPGMSEASIVPQQLECAGIEINEVFTKLIEEC